MIAAIAVTTAPPEVIVRDMLLPDRAVDDYLADCRRRRMSERTVTTYARTLDQFASRPDVRDLDVSKITRNHVSRYLATKSHLARGTVSGFETHLYTWFEYLENTEPKRIARNPMHGMVRTKRAAAEDLDVVTVGGEDVRRLLELARPGAERNAIAILAYLGPRRHAVALLRLRDYNRGTGEIRFHEKGDKVIWKPIPAELQVVLEGSIARGEIREAPEDYLVPPEGYLQRKGDRDDRVIWRLVKKVAARAGVDAHVHALRGAFAVFYLESFGRDTYGLQKSMGHTSMKTTETYLRRYDQRQAMQPLRKLSWASAFSTSSEVEKAEVQPDIHSLIGVSGGNSDSSGIPQIAAKWLEESQVMGAGGFEPPFPDPQGNSQAKPPTPGTDPESVVLDAIEQRLAELRALRRRSNR